MRARPAGRALTLSLAVCALAAAPVAAPAAPSSQPALTVTLGFDGAIRPGVPAPVDVLTGPMPAGGPAELMVDTPTLAPQTGRATVSTAVPFQAVAGSPQRLRVPVVIQDVRHPIRVRLLLAGRSIARANVPIDPARVAGRLVVLVSDVRAGLGVLRRLDERAVDAYVAADALPTRWQEYASVDLLVLRDLDPARLADAQRTALLTWVRLGGRLLLIARPDAPPPAFLDPILPARPAGPRVLASSADLTARFGGQVPAGLVPAVALVPQPGAAVVRADGVSVAAAAAAGDGWVTVWGIDPTVPPLAAWDGRVRLWAAALGAPRPAIAEPTVLAERLSPRVPVDRFSHLAAGVLIVLYIGGLAVLRRRRPTPAAAAAGGVAAVVAVAVFTTLAVGARARSTALTQVVVVQQAREAPVARALTVAAATVPYGGPVEVEAPSGAVAAPVTMLGDLRVVWRGGGAVLAGVVRPDAPWVFQAMSALPLRTSAGFGPDAETLTTDLGTAGLRAAGVWWRGFVYPLGDLPAGRSVRSVPGRGWRRASDVVADDQSPARFFRAPESQAPGAIVELSGPVLVGAWAGPVPAFALPKRAGTRAALDDVILVVPIAGPAPREAQP